MSKRGYASRPLVTRKTYARLLAGRWVRRTYARERLARPAYDLLYIAYICIKYNVLEL